MQKAIMHIDGDSFFASCEISLNHKLRGKPVVTGKERGIATAMSKEAKALGISRGMPIFKVKKLFPQVVVRQSDYLNYSLFSKRMFNIVRRYTDKVEEYSIDECFADLTGLDIRHGGYRQLLTKIKNDLQRELGMTFSLGLAPTKVLAKVASKWEKPDGLTVLPQEEILKFLALTQIGKIWGIGPSTARVLERDGIETAKDLIDREERWAKESLNKPILEIYYELRGLSIFRVHDTEEDDQKSIQSTRTFTPASRDKNFILSELSKNLETASGRARRQGIVAKRVYYFLKTQEFRYHRREIVLDQPLGTPAEILEKIEETFDSVYRKEFTYRATGITLADLSPEAYAQEDLFGKSQNAKRWKEVFDTVDELDERYGSHTLVLGSSLSSFKARGGLGTHKRLRLLSLGEVV